MQTRGWRHGLRITRISRVIAFAALCLLPGGSPSEQLQRGKRAPPPPPPPPFERPSLTKIEDYEEARQLHVHGDRLIWLDIEKKTVYQARMASPPPEQADKMEAQTVALAAPAERVFAGRDLRNPVAVSVDEQGTIFALDAETRTVFYKDPRGESRNISLSQYLTKPTGMAHYRGRLYITDPGDNRIVSMAGWGDTPVEAFRSKSGQVPERIIASEDGLLGLDPVGKRLLRLVAAPAGLWLAAEFPLATAHTPTDLAAFGDMVYVLDEGRRSLLIQMRTGGRSSSFDYRRVLPEPECLAISSGWIYTADDDIDSIVRIPLVVPATIYFEGGDSSKNVLKTYEYLHHELNLLPTAEYSIGDAGSISRLVTQNEVLPQGYDGEIQPLICALNRGLCDKEGEYRVYSATKKVELPELKQRRYLARRTFTFPLDPNKYAYSLYDKYRGKPIGEFARALSPRTPPDELRKIMEQLNYFYRGQDIMAETGGTFVIPVESLTMEVLLPWTALAGGRTPIHEMARISPMNVMIASPAAGGAKAKTTPAVTAPPEEASGSPPQPPVDPDPKCEPVEARFWTPELKAVRYCLPRNMDRSVQIGVVDHVFDPLHRAFRKQNQGSRLCKCVRLVTGPTTEVDCEAFGATPPARSRPQEWGEFVQDDHGTYVSGIIAAGPTDQGMTGIHPLGELYGVPPLMVKELLSSVWTIRIFNVSLGENPTQPHVQGEIDFLKELIRLQPTLLFVISAGNDGKEVELGKLASLAALYDNVIVVGAAGAGASLHPKSNHESRYVHIAAPGENIRSTTFGGAYGSNSGTSAAAAFVTGTAAILQSQVGSHHWMPWQIRDRIVATSSLWTHGHGDKAKIFGGLLDIQRAVLDVDAALLTLFADPKTTYKGSIAPRDLRKTLAINMGAREVPLQIPFRDVRRIQRHPDGFFTVIYSKVEDGSGVHRLHRVTDKLGQDLNGEFGFDCRKKMPAAGTVAGASDCVKGFIKANQIEDFVNETIDR